MIRMIFHHSGGTALVSLALVALVIVVLMLSTSRKYRTAIFSYLLHQVHTAYRKSKLFHAVGRIATDRKCPKGLPQLDVFEEVSPRCVRILGLNPGSHTLQGTNTWLLGAGKGRILVDTGEDITAKEYVNLLLDKVFPSTGTEYLTAILLTHGHGDHQGGVIDLLRELRRRKMLPLPKICKRIVPDGDFPPRDFVCEHIEDGQRFVVESSDSPQAEDGACNTERRSTRSASKSKRPVITATIEAIYTPGHTDDHVAFFVHEDAALLSGDCVLGCGTTVFDHLPTYMQSLQKLKNLTLPPALRSSYCNACVDNKAESPDASNSNLLIKAIYPGHGPVISEDVTGKVDSYIEHRAMRERQILAQLSALKPNDEWISTWELMNKVYPSLAAYVKVSAQWNVLHHLDKLNGEGIVETKFPDLWRLKK